MKFQASDVTYNKHIDAWLSIFSFDNMVSAKCLLCSKSFNKKELLKQHYTDEHNVTSSDEILNRYTDLRFSQAKNVDLAKKESMLLRLLKLLRERVSYYALTQEKVKLSDFNLEAIFDKFVNADEIDSTASTEENSSLYWQRYELVKWFLQHYEVFTNDAAEYRKETMLMSRFSHSERAYKICAMQFHVLLHLLALLTQKYIQNQYYCQINLKDCSQNIQIAPT